MRDTLLEKNKDLKNFVFDTTGTGYFELAPDKKAPDIAELNAVLKKDGAARSVTITRLHEVELPKTEALYEVQISGLG